MWQIASRLRLLQIDCSQAVLKGTKGIDIAGYKLRTLGRVVHNLPDIALWPVASMVGSMRPSDLHQELFCIRNCTLVLCMCGPGSSVGIAIGYGLDGQEIESRWGWDFPHLSRPSLGPTQLPVQWVRGLSRGKERPGRDADPLPSFSAVVTKG